MSIEMSRDVHYSLAAAYSRVSVLLWLSSLDYLYIEPGRMVVIAACNFYAMSNTNLQSIKEKRSCQFKLKYNCNCNYIFVHLETQNNLITKVFV